MESEQLYEKWVRNCDKSNPIARTIAILCLGVVTFIYVNVQN